jgi:hypothetical protein
MVVEVVSSAEPRRESTLRGLDMPSRMKATEQRRQPTPIGRIVTAAHSLTTPGPYLVALRAAPSKHTSLYLAIHLGLHRTAVMHPLLASTKEHLISARG